MIRVGEKVQNNKRKEQRLAVYVHNKPSLLILGEDVHHLLQVLDTAWS